MSIRKLLPLFFGLGLAAHAGVIMTVSFSPQQLSGLPGTTVQLSGTLTNNDTNTQFIVSDSVTFPFAVDDTPFFINSPLSLLPGELSSPFVFLDIPIPVGQAQGLYNGQFTVIGGTDPNGQNILGAGNFAVEVVPEPSTVLLLGGGLVLLVRRKLR